MFAFLGICDAFPWKGGSNELIGGSILILHKELRLITRCFISSKPIPPQKPYTLQTWKTRRRCKGPSVPVCIVLLMAPLTARQANNLKRTQLEKGISVETSQVESYHWFHGGLRFENSASNFAARHFSLSLFICCCACFSRIKPLLKYHLQRDRFTSIASPSDSGPLLHLLARKTSSPNSLLISSPLQT